MTDSPYNFNPSDAAGLDATSTTGATDNTTDATALVDQENPADNNEVTRRRRPRVRSLTVTMSCLAFAGICAGITAYNLHRVEGNVASVATPTPSVQLPATADDQDDGGVVSGAIAGMPAGGGFGATIRDCLDAGPDATDEEKEALADKYDFRVCTDQENAEFYQRLAELTPSTPPTWDSRP